MEMPSHSRQLLLQLNTQRAKGFLCDVIIVVQNALFRAHKNILAASSAYLKSLVVHDNLLNLDHEMVSPGVFRLVLDFIYTGRLGECEPGEQGLGAVLAAASYLQVPALVALCKKKLKGLRAATPVIQTCYSGAPRPVDMQPGEPHNPLSTQCGELYASASQGTVLHQPGLCPPERHCSPPCGLDLSKKSPTSPSSQLLPTDRLHPGDSREPLLPPGHDSPRGSTSLLVNHSSAYKEPPPAGEGVIHPTPGSYLEECEAGKDHLAYEPESLGDNLYVCIPCGKGFPSSEQLNAHVEAHTEEELYHKAASDLGDIRGTMTRHMRSHLGLKPFACDACGMRFTRQYRLTEHMRIHSGEKPYECQVCGGKFAQQRNLISHMKMHVSLLCGISGGDLAAVSLGVSAGRWAGSMRTWEQFVKPQLSFSRGGPPSCLTRMQREACPLPWLVPRQIRAPGHRACRQGAGLLSLYQRALSLR
uniref:HIC ZBTB transcriptional repressor 1 n=1 Tax=Gopherus evgoodei TaxID=1825980 RepID=A0A8C4W9J3_9SAUR